MTDTWAAKVLEGVDKYTDIHTTDDLPVVFLDEVIAAIAKLGAGDGLVERATAALEGVTPGKPVQFHPSYCEEAKGAPFSEWDSSHDLSVILPDGKRYRIGSFRHAADAGFYHFTRQWVPEAAAHIAALTAERDYTHGTNEVLRSENQRLEAERDALRAKVARLEGALRLLHDNVVQAFPTVADLGPVANARAALTDGGKHE